jgi:shikimate 5-dehydrogenase
MTDLYDEAAETLAKEINAKFGSVAKFIPFADRASVKRAFSESGVVMNCSGVGMAPHLEESPIDPDAFRSGQLAFDATYNPEKTQFLKDAERSAQTSSMALACLCIRARCSLKSGPGWMNRAN